MKNDPRIITARFNSVCAETGRAILTGDPCVYYPIGKKVYCWDSKQAQEFRDFQFDTNCL